MRKREKLTQVMFSLIDGLCYGGNEEFEKKIIGEQRERIKLLRWWKGEHGHGPRQEYKWNRDNWTRDV